jgi:serine/threonine protein kinase
MPQNLGTTHWMSPELLCKCLTYTSKVDIYPYGIIIWELATGMPTHIGQKGTVVAVRVREEDIRPDLPPMSTVYRDYIGEKLQALKLLCQSAKCPSISLGGHSTRASFMGYRESTFTLSLRLTVN